MPALDPSPAVSTPKLPPGVSAAAMAIDQARLLIERTLAALYGAVVAAIGMALVLQTPHNAAAVWSWVVAVVLVHVLRVVLVGKARTPGILEAAPRRWLLGLRLGVLAAGASWAVVPLWLYPATESTQLLVALIMTAIAGAGIAGLAVDAVAAALFILPFGLPMAVRLIASELKSLQIIGFLALAYIAYLLYVATYVQKLFHELLVLRVQATTEARVDPLTDLPNRNGLNLDLERAVARAQRNDRMLAVGYIDLDDFKQVNDQFGHAAGDALLQQLALRWRRMLRTNETIARLGGDEFVILIEDLDRDSACTHIEAVATRIHAAVETAFDLPGVNASARVGMTMGVACYPGDGDTPDMLLRQADAAMYPCKQRKAVRTRWWAFSPQMAEPGATP